MSVGRPTSLNAERSVPATLHTSPLTQHHDQSQPRSFHPAGSSIPINDKVLHFGCFLLATALFYAVWDVDESARRHSALWRQMPLVLTFAVCFLVGGIGSEFIQSLLPYKRFDALDILANLFGSSLGLWLSYHAERRYRLDREVRRLYRPLDPEEYGDEVEEDFGLMDDGDEEGIDGDGNPQTRGASVCSVRQSQATVEAIRSGLEDVWCTASVEDTGARGVSSEPRYAGAGNDLFSIGAEEGEQDETETETRTSRGGHNESNCDMSSGGASARTPTDESQAAWGTVPSPSARLQ